MLQQPVEDIGRIAQRARNNDAVKAGELIAGEVVVSHAALYMEVLAVGPSVERSYWNNEPQPIRRSHLPTAKSLRQRNPRLRVHQTSIGASQSFGANVVLLHPR